MSDCDGDVVEEFTCLEENLFFVLEKSDCEPQISNAAHFCFQCTCFLAFSPFLAFPFAQHGGA